MVPIKYTKTELVKILKRYSSKQDLKIKNFEIYQYAKRNHDFNKIAPHFKKDKSIKPRIYWNKSLVIKKAKTYTSYKQFCDFHSSGYRYAKRNGFLEEVKSLYSPSSKSKFKIYTYEKILEIASKCVSYTDFSQNYPGPHQQSFQQGWNNQIKAYLDEKLKKQFNKEKVIKLTQSFEQITEFRKLHRNEYLFLKLHNLLNNPRLLIQKEPSKYSIKYTDQEIILEALKYKTKSEFCEKSRGMYEAALRRNIMSQISSHMKEKVWYKEEVVREIFETIFKKKFGKIRPEWLKNPKTNMNLELDGYCEELKIAFEYNGPHHYDKTYHLYDSKVVWKDNFKKKRCKELGITLYVFKATTIPALKKEIASKLKLPRPKK